MLLSLLVGSLPLAPRIVAAPLALAAGPVLPLAVPAAQQPQPLAPIASNPVPHPEPPPPSVPARASTQQRPPLGPLPMRFLPNTGQSHQDVRFQAHGLGGMVFFTQSDIVMSLPAVPTSLQADRPAQAPQRAARPALAVRINYEGANQRVQPIGQDRLAGTSHLLVGRDPTRWRTNVATFASVQYPALYPGIDLQFSGAGAQLKSTYTIAPGADPTAIRWFYTGALKPVVRPINWPGRYGRILPQGGWHEDQSAHGRTDYQAP